MKKAIILLHGFLSDCDDFAPLYVHLEQRYEHIEKVSYPGHGQGENYWDFDCDKTFDVVEKAISKIRANYQVIDVIGFSMGGALAVYLAKNYDINKLVLLAPGNKYFNFFLPYSMLKFFFFNLVSLEKAVIQKHEFEKAAYISKMNTAIADDKEGLRFLTERYLKPYFLLAFKNFANLVKKANDGVKEIKCPCFIAWGELDQLVPKKSATYIFDMCSNNNKKLKIYDHLSHLMLRSTDHLELMNDILIFLNE